MLRIHLHGSIIPSLVNIPSDNCVNPTRNSARCEKSHDTRNSVDGAQYIEALEPLGVGSSCASGGIREQVAHEWIQCT